MLDGYVRAPSDTLRKLTSTVIRVFPDFGAYEVVTEPQDVIANGIRMDRTYYGRSNGR